MTPTKNFQGVKTLWNHVSKYLNRAIQAIEKAKRLPTYLIVLVGCLVFFNSLFNGFIIGDDEEQILLNPLVQSLNNLPQFFLGSTYYEIASKSNFGLFYRPLMLSSYSLIYAVVGPDPFMFHLVQVVFHLGNGLLLFLLFKKLKLSRLVAFFASLLFLIHPINSETVFHIANLQEVLFLFFGLVSTLIYINSFKTKNLFHQAVVSLFLLIALFAKETAILFIVLIALYTWVYQRSKLRSMFVVIPPILVYVFFRLKLAQVHYQIPQISQIGELSLNQRLFQVPSVVWYYLKTFLFPAKLVTQQFWLVASIQWFDLVAFVSFCLAIIFIGFRLKSHQKLYWFFGGWLLVGLGLHSQVMPLYLTVAERWFYFPSIGVIGLVASMAANFLGKKTLMIFFTSILVILSVRTFVRSFDWRDSYSLLEADLGQAENDYYNQNLYGSLLIREGAYQQAEPYILQSTSQHKFIGNMSNLGSVYLHQQKLEDAERAYKQSLELGQSYTSLVNYVNFLFYFKKDYQTTQTVIASYLPHYRNGYDLWLVQAQLYAQTGDYSKALQSAQIAYQLHQSQITAEVLRQVKAKEPIQIGHLLSN